MTISLCKSELCSVAVLASPLSRNLSNIPQPSSSANTSTSQKVDATVLVAKDLHKMFAEIHLELDNEIKHNIELADMAK